MKNINTWTNTNTQPDNTKQQIPTSPELRKAQCDIARALNLNLMIYRIIRLLILSRSGLKTFMSKYSEF